jgi:hypothetical protein
MNMSEAVFALLGGLFGYGLGRAQFQAWEGFINKYNERLGHLSFNHVIEPLGFYDRVESARKIYAEAIFAYLAGLPDASLPMIFRCLEIGLKQHYEVIEGKKPSLRAVELIEWSEKKLGSKAELAHGFRILRNLIHEEKTIPEQDNLEAIRHVTQILNFVFPFQTANITVNCVTCRRSNTMQVSPNQLFLGNNVAVPCTVCRVNTIYQVMPPYPEVSRSS